MNPLPRQAGIPRIIRPGGGIAAGWVESQAGHSAETAVTDPGYARGMAAAWQTVACQLDAAPLPAPCPEGFTAWNCGGCAGLSVSVRPPDGLCAVCRSAPSPAGQS